MKQSMVGAQLQVLVFLHFISPTPVDPSLFVPINTNITKCPKRPTVCWRLVCKNWNSKISCQEGFLIQMTKYCTIHVRKVAPDVETENIIILIQCSSLKVLLCNTSGTASYIIYVAINFVTFEFSKLKNIVKGSITNFHSYESG